MRKLIMSPFVSADGFAADTMLSPILTRSKLSKLFPMEFEDLALHLVNTTTCKHAVVQLIYTIKPIKSYT
ncbi:hypothetical protein B0I21_107280 [Sphingobacterium paludis]|uniref:Uncharacterized protein n=1 Tax=Sphingobacterium paludis TaxID=1476465 RepID=A0A4V3E154_9SPHI|nr:hypothetical protein B0I21_107280 [Sphingobacterium paludis]